MCCQRWVFMGGQVPYTNGEPWLRRRNQRDRERELVHTLLVHLVTRGSIPLVRQLPVIRSFHSRNKHSRDMSNAGVVLRNFPSTNDDSARTAVCVRTCVCGWVRVGMWGLVLYRALSMQVCVCWNMWGERVYICLTEKKVRKRKGERERKEEQEKWR